MSSFIAASLFFFLLLFVFLVLFVDVGGGCAAGSGLIGSFPFSLSLLGCLPQLFRLKAVSLVSAVSSSPVWENVSECHSSSSSSNSIDSRCILCVCILVQTTKCDNETTNSEQRSSSSSSTTTTTTTSTPVVVMVIAHASFVVCYPVSQSVSQWMSTLAAAEERSSMSDAALQFCC